MQNAYITKLLELAEKDERICHLLADSGTNYDVHFHRNFPDRMFNFGIAEQNAIGAAAGMALAGKIPFVFLQGAFIVYRAMEFVRNDICGQNANVKLIGQGSGLSCPGLGYTHHTTEDIAILRTLPNLRIYSPATPIQVGKCMERISSEDGPCYMRIGMNDEKEYFDEEYFMPDCGQDIMRDGEDAALFVTGSILEEAMDAAESLAANGIHIQVVNIVRLKPFADTILLNAAKKAKKIFTLEEHQTSGGLRGIICEELCKNGIGIPVVGMGLEDQFAKGYAPTQKQLRIENRIDCRSIAGRIAEALNE